MFNSKSSLPCDISAVLSVKSHGRFLCPVTILTTNWGAGGTLTVWPCCSVMRVRDHYLSMVYFYIIYLFLLWFIVRFTGDSTARSSPSVMSRGSDDHEIWGCRPKLSTCDSLKKQNQLNMMLWWNMPVLGHPASTLSKRVVWFPCGLCSFFLKAEVTHRF